MLPEALVAELAERGRRFHHYLWHRVRDSWSRLTDAERGGVGEVNPGWVPPRPSTSERLVPARDNGSGEDFLFMHRQMLEWANGLLTRMGRLPVVGWARLPPPGDADYPVPAFHDSGLDSVKSDNYYHGTLAAWERKFNDVKYLRAVTLGQLGSDIEVTLHNAVHMRWSSPSAVGYRPATNIFSDIETKWDDPAYDYLGDTYSSHVNAIFWKLHGWIDGRARAWELAHGRTSAAPLEPAWIGPEEYRRFFLGTGSYAPCAEEEMVRVDQIISASRAGAVDGFFRPGLSGLHG